MTDNPYVGTEWETSWQDGHDAGLAQPGSQVDPPAVLEENQAQAYREGVLAGQQDAAAEGTPIQINPITPAEPEDGKGVELAATAVFAFAGWAAEWADAGLSGGIGVAVHLLIAVGIPEGEPLPDLSDPAELAAANTRSVRAMGADELFLPFCQNPQHSATGDQVTEQGFWHGNAFTDYWAAFPVAEEHLKAEPDSLSQVGLLHARADSDGVEWIELT
ncbi:hypothetical protein [Microlunatus flavus]|uniref:Uncharacterized protein n=1 Tax=Microlunatus flavus TaxID=1036181 RepID=A0A1H9FSB4_9ACTN|nr:hypothetical protein [Microlunatus flavus]SEQ40368.1 hypothetical protein SAMN05421756_103353 [Microlunatus flavus]